MKMQTLSHKLTKWLIINIIIALFITMCLGHFIGTYLIRKQASSILESKVSELKHNIQEFSDDRLLFLSHLVAERVNEAWGHESNHLLDNLAENYDISEISIVDGAGIIRYSTNRSFINFYMPSGQQSSGFMCLIETQKEMVQEFQTTSMNPSLSRKYGGVALKRGGFVMVGFNYQDYLKDIEDNLENITKFRSIGSEGYLLVCDKGKEILSGPEKYIGLLLQKLNLTVSDPEHITMSLILGTVNNTRVYYMFDYLDGYYLIAVLKASDISSIGMKAILLCLLAEIILCAVIIFIVVFLNRYYFVANISRIIKTLSKITSGDLDSDVFTDYNILEFSILAKHINTTREALKKLIKNVRERFDAELEISKSIQLSSLPSVYPPFPHRKDFDIYAGMSTAKEVGGDFFDFYFIDSHRLCFLIADVSGKGVPAAMFMMTTKTLIKNIADANVPVNELLTKANTRLCRNNKTNMFVSCWLGVIDLETGIINYSNAGHTPPLIQHMGGDFDYLRSDNALVLAYKPDYEYKVHQIKLLPGDSIILYTDGIPEACNPLRDMYGNDRLRMVATINKTKTVKEMVLGIKRDLDEFVNGNEPNDDETLLILRYNGKPIL